MPEHLRAVKQLGRGAYGSVHLCDDTVTGNQVAVKHIKNAARHGKSILREVRLLSRLRHENLLHLLDLPALGSPDFEDVFLVLPYMPTDLHKVIQSRQNLSEKHMQVVICQIFRALAHLHGAGVAHRDLKPANILLTADCRLKICDFGLARGDMHMAATGEASDCEEAPECGVLTEYVVTRWYRAPEVMLLPKQYSTALDIWAVGCIICEMLGRRAVFPGKNHVDMVCRYARTLGTPRDDELTWLPRASDAYKFLRNVCPQTEGVPLSSLYPNASPACLRLTRSLLQWDPAQRPTATDAQAHEYLKVYLPKQPVSPPEPFDWGFDGFRPTLQAVKDRLYRESLRFESQKNKPAEREKSVTACASSSTPRSSTPRGVSQRQTSPDRLREASVGAERWARQRPESVRRPQQQREEVYPQQMQDDGQAAAEPQPRLSRQRSYNPDRASSGAQYQLPPAPPALSSGSGRTSARRSSSNLIAAPPRSTTPVRGATTSFGQRVATELHPRVQGAPWWSSSSSCMVR